MSHRSVRLNVPVLARVEGEGAMHVEVTDGEVTDVRLEIYEPPRFFEAFLRGRAWTEPADITARICGICPVAYQMSACRAVERLGGIRVDDEIGELRRLLYCGEWIASHGLHIGFLHAPDFLGFHSGFDLAADHPDMVEGLLHLKRTGNRIMEAIGGRAIHPINIRVGGFHRAPTISELEDLVPDLEESRTFAIELVRWTAGFDFPDLSHDYEFVSIRNGERYPFIEGRVVSNRGLDIDQAEFEDHIVEDQVAHSTALHGRLRTGGWCHVGPLARWANNADLLPGDVIDLAAEVGIGPTVTNPFRSIIVRSLETFFALDEALRLIDRYRPPVPAAVNVPPRAGAGAAITEAPRGVLYHRYRTEADGTITEARIIPPTSQNLPTIEADLRRFVTGHLDLDRAELEHRCEQVIRNYDPCISCATHFLDLTIEHRTRS
ncbi:MAG: Ni/Fe hydrogenase subunit alpha [Acidimicrobiia bacterium]|nr:Ni/Fe hydrogenase subunit alpha [Acidimicrobiia bacterium]